MREALLHTLAHLSEPVATWRAYWRATLPAPSMSPSEALEVTELAAADGRQRVVNVAAKDLQAMHDHRLELEKALVDRPASNHVKPWIWNAATSTGQALSAHGEEVGFELRLSRYAKPVR